jgi:lipopolysaccharide export system permease protein
MLSQYLLFFGFFALILIAVMWINRAVVLFDRLIGDGQSALVFLEFTALVLPNLVRMVLPLAGFIAALYVTNRLIRDSELTVMQATGSSPWRLARPALAFGLVAAGMMSVLTHLLLPASLDQLKIREAEVARNVTARLLSEGTFLHPADGVTFYIRAIDPDGTLRDVFLSDQRNPAHSVTYTGARAFLVRDGDKANLIMVDGLAQRRDIAQRTLSTTVFADFSYDISDLVRERGAGGRSVSQIPTPELILDRERLATGEGHNRGRLAEELHERFARALSCIAVILIGFSALMLGGFSRFGVWRQVGLAFVAVIGLEIMRGALAEQVLTDPGRWPLIYLPTVAGLGFAALCLGVAGRPLTVLLRRRTGTVAGPAGGGA